jgi:hypothetical protein
MYYLSQNTEKQNNFRKLTSKFYSFQRFDKKKMEKHEEVK